MTEQERDDYTLLAWAKFKASTGDPEESFTDRDRLMFIAGIKWFVAEETRPE